MSIWRAPLLIIGILLLLLAAVALAAPWFVDWNRYRPQLAAWGEAVTGRDVTIAGDVDFVLFPWPAARLHDVRIASTPESRFRNLLVVAEVEARFSLGALFGGRLEVESVRLRRPVLSLEHYGDGRGNWRLTPRANVRLPFAPERISIDSVRVEGGVLQLADKRLHRTLTLSELNIRIRAPRLTGPWRLQGSFSALDRKWQMRAATGELSAGKPVSLSLQLEPPEDAGGHTFSLNGELEPAAERSAHPRFNGSLTLSPRLARGRGDPLDPARQVTLSARVRATPTLLELKKLKVSPKFPQSSPFDTITGNVRIEPGRLWNAFVMLRTARLKLGPRLDSLLGLPPHDATRAQENTLAALRRHLGALATRMPALPPELLLELDAQATTVKAGAREFSRASLSAEITRELFTIRHLRAEMPEVASLSFQGDLLGGDVLQLTGRLEVNAPDARGLLFSLFPAAERALRPAWRGVPGRLSLVAAIDLTDAALRMVSHRMKLDGAALKIDWRRTGAKEEGPADTIRLQAQRWNIDRLLGNHPGAALALAKGVAGLGGHALSVRARADELQLAGLRWRGVRLAFSHGPRGLALKTLEVADLGGLKLSASGDFRPPAQATRADVPWRGRLAARLKGDEAAAVWRALANLWPGAQGPAPDWLRRLGAVDLGLSLHLDPAGTNGARRLRAALDGTAGPARIDLSAEGEGRLAHWREGRWRLDGMVKSGAAAPLLALARLRPPPEEGPARITLRAKGVPAKELATSAAISLPGLDARWKGSIALAEDGSSLLSRSEGALSLKLADAAHWAAELGVAMPTDMPLEGALHVAFSPRHLVLRRMTLDLGGNRAGGELAFTWPDEITGELEGARATLKGRLSVDHADLATIAALLLARPDDANRLRERIAAGWALNVTLTADAVTLFRPAWRLPRARLALKTDEEGALNAELIAGDDARDLRATARLRREPLGLGTHLRTQLALPLSAVLHPAGENWRAGGRLKLNLSAKGRAASLRGIPLALKGNGGLAFLAVRFKGFSPQLLPRTLRVITDEERLREFDELAREQLFGDAWRWPEEVQAGLVLENGLLELTPAAWKTDDIATRLSGLADVRTGNLDITLELAATGSGPDVPPPYALALAGSPGALTVSPRLDTLRDWLQQRLIRLKEERLKKLEEERRRLEEQARRLEEEQRRREEEERRRQRADELKQNADELRRRLQDVLARAWREERARRRENQGAPAAPAETESPKTIEDLIREAQREERTEKAANPAEPPAAKPESSPPVSPGQPAVEPVRPLPDAAQAQPKGPIVIVPHPRPARVRALAARRRAEREAAKKRPAPRRKSAPKAASPQAAATPETNRANSGKPTPRPQSQKPNSKPRAPRQAAGSRPASGGNGTRPRIIYNWNRQPQASAQ